ncbi:hypothetical protein BIV25_45010 [Streptomyces sp. MUSC 14]|uniref:hypothetical protein n=1 Tax=Streptomyces sp. MUSC 14 TaxID=1354889 RepID=UPI0008F5BAE7|nr:hypothetical protein [Streptomyces sp. MUSC 14]OIJ85068.1 hypothetical protein BIV25_45010 [Streptomyces sp. MUSC 14]
MTASEAVVLIVVVIVAASLAAAGLPVLSVCVLIARACAAGVKALLQLRASRPAEPEPTRA